MRKSGIKGNLYAHLFSTFAPMKWGQLLFLLLWCHTGMAQDTFIMTESKKIDSLIFYCNFQEGEQKTDSLYNYLIKNDPEKKHTEVLLHLLLNKAYLYARDHSPHKALKVALNVIDQAKMYGLPEKEYQACLMAATMYEHSDELDICKHYLDQAFQLYRKYELEHVYAVYCIRLSSYYRFKGEKEAAIRYAKQALNYAKQYGNRREYIDGCLLLGSLLSEKNYNKAAKYALLAANAFLKKKDYEGAANLYNNTSAVYLRHKKINEALLYNDSALWVVKTYSASKAYYVLKTRHQLFNAMGNADSAYYYLQQYHTAYVNDLTKKESLEIRKITEQYENDKKEAALNSKNLQLILIICLLGIITIATVLIFRKNRKIHVQNKIISSQVEELMKTLEQKQVLLSELQHRVKNNLQHVISILEIQKESVDFNNIDELIRGNQNRIRSMALLHKKLHTTEDVNTVDLNRYVTELSDLVKESYDNHKKEISLNVTCDVATLSIERALPLGLIIVELVSNSMKHAFHKRSIGIINIAITKEQDSLKLYYADNGSGFDFNTTSKKGLGQEIIKGLIDQLDGTTETKNNNGFELIIYFKQDFGN